MSTSIEEHQVADNVFVFTGTDVNWVIIQDGDDLTLVDAGWNGDIQQVERSIRSLGRQPQDLQAVLLTHAHADHTGALNHLHDNYGIPLYMSAVEVPNARGEAVETGGPIDVAKRMYRPQVVRWAARMRKVGGLDHFTTPAAAAFPNDGPLDLPGRPIPVASPGHTSGHTSYFLPQVGALITGDALVTGHPTFTGLGPRLLPADFTHDQAGAIDTLHTLRGVDADLLLPGHGPTWYGPVSEAVDQALSHTKHQAAPYQPSGQQGTD